MHWATDLIGKPWVFGGIGPDAFDCWGLARHVQAWRYGINMMPVGQAYDKDWRLAQRAIETAEERASWLPVDKPQDGDCVLMARQKIPIHIGVWIDANGTQGVLHCVEGQGVVYTIAKNLQLSGWGRVQYFRHVSKCS